MLGHPQSSITRLSLRFPRARGASRYLFAPSLSPLSISIDDRAEQSARKYPLRDHRAILARYVRDNAHRVNRYYRTIDTTSYRTIVTRCSRNLRNLRVTSNE